MKAHSGFQWLNGKSIPLVFESCLAFVCKIEFPSRPSCVFYCIMPKLNSLNSKYSVHVFYCTR